MNQGNSARSTRDDGGWQDGGIFLAFQSQSWHTDDTTGHAISGGPQTDTPRVRVLAAEVNPLGPAPEEETVLLINVSPDDVDLTEWTIADKNKATSPVPAGPLAAGQTIIVLLDGGAQLGNKGGQITLLDGAGLKVHGVAYTKADAEREGWTVTF